MANAPPPREPREPRDRDVIVTEREGDGGRGPWNVVAALVVAIALVLVVWLIIDAVGGEVDDGGGGVDVPEEIDVNVDGGGGGDSGGGDSGGGDSGGGGS